jgi:hypothetical protein
MRNTKVLLFLGILLGSLVITGFAYFIQPAFLQFLNAEPLQVKDQASVSGRINDCQSNMEISDAVKQWCEPMAKQALNTQLDTMLLAALITVESGGQPDALSSSGAVGLMQVMPRDGIASQFQCSNGPCFAKRPSITELLDSDFNIQYGSQLLAGLVNQYDGDIREALKSYGPHDRGYQYADLVLSVYQDYTK